MPNIDISAVGSGEVYIGNDRVTATTVTRPIGGSVYVSARAYPGNVFQKWIVISDLYGRTEHTNNPQTFYVGQDFSIQAVFVGTGGGGTGSTAAKEYVFEFSGQINQNSLIVSAASKIVTLLGGKSVYIVGNKLVVVM